MSNIAFRDSSVIIIETGRSAVRANFGLAELLKTPPIEVDARVGLRRSASEEGTSTTLPEAKVNEYLVGQQIDEAVASGNVITIIRPFADGTIKDYTAAEAIWKHIIFKLLGVKRTQNESPVLLTFPHGLSRDAYERVCQIFFERFNCAAVSMLERPLAQIFATNALNGLVVDIGDDQTDVAPIYECSVQHNCVDYMPIGLSDCEKYLANLLQASEQVVSVLSPPEAPLSPEELATQLRALTRQIWREGHVKLGEADAQSGDDEGVTNIAAVLVAGKEKAVIESNVKKRQNAKASAAEQARAREIEALDLITINFQEKEVTLGRERHHFLDPLFEPSVLRGLEGFESKVWLGDSVASLQEVCGRAVAKADLDAKLSIWDGLFVTGDCTNAIKGIGTALQKRLSHYIIGNPDHQNDAQPKQTRVLHVPEYFAEYREIGDSYAAFLGASIVAKLIFADPLGKNFVSKGDYTSKGPRAILEMSASLL